MQCYQLIQGMCVRMQNPFSTMKIERHHIALHACALSHSNHLPNTPSSNLHFIFFASRWANNSGWPFSSCLTSQILRLYTHFSMPNFLIKIKVPNVIINESYFLTQCLFLLVDSFGISYKLNQKALFLYGLKRVPHNFEITTLYQVKQKIKFLRLAILCESRVSLTS